MSTVVEGDQKAPFSIATTPRCGGGRYSLPLIAPETRVQSQVESYQRLKKRYLIPPCLTLSIIRYVSRVKWNNPGKRVASSPTPRCSSYWKGSLRIALDYSHQLYLFLKLLSNITIFFLYESLSSSCHAASTDLPDPRSPPISIVHRTREVFKAKYCIVTELLYIGSSWSSCLCSSIWRGPQE